MNVHVNIVTPSPSDWPCTPLSTGRLAHALSTGTKPKRFSSSYTVPDTMNSRAWSLTASSGVSFTLSLQRDHQLGYAIHSWPANL